MTMQWVPMSVPWWEGAATPSTIPLPPTATKMPSLKQSWRPPWRDIAGKWRNWGWSMRVRCVEQVVVSQLTSLTNFSSCLFLMYVIDKLLFIHFFNVCNWLTYLLILFWSDVCNWLVNTWTHPLLLTSWCIILLMRT